MLTVSRHRLLCWLAEEPLQRDNSTDVQGERIPPESEEDQLHRATRDFLVWRGREHSVVTREMDHIRPNDVVVVRVDERGLQGLGQTVPGSAGFEEGLDVWERAFHQARGKAVLRLNRELWEPWKGHPAVAALFMVFDDADFDQNEL